MRITLLNVPDPAATLAQLVDAVEAAAAAGFGRVWLPQLPTAPGTPAWDALTTLAVVGQRVPDIGLGTGVAIAHTAHPLMMARQALTASAAVDGRLLLGLGVSHPAMIEALGYSYAKPVAFLEEYLQVLLPALAGDAIDHHGPRITAVGEVHIPGAPAPRVVLAALGPAMLDLAGRLAEGTMTTWANRKALEDHIVPRITTAAARAGRGAPEVIVGLPVAVTNDTEHARAEISAAMSAAEGLPAYRSLLSKGGVSGVADVSIIGDEDHVRTEIGRLADVGATEFVGSTFGDADTVDRTTALLAELGSAYS